MRLCAAESLGRLKHSKAIEPLRKIVESDKDGWVRLVAKESIGMISVSESEKGLRQGKVSVVSNLFQTIKEQTEHEKSWGTAVIDYAEDTLLKNGKNITEPVVRILKNGDSYVRVKAAEVLGKIGNAKAVEPLLAFLKDDNQDVRENVTAALGKIKDPKTVEPLITALANDAYWRVRDKAAEALGEIKDSRAVKPLIDVLKQKDVENNFRVETISALGKIKDFRAIEPLIAVLKEKGDVPREGVVSGGVKMP